MSLNKSKPVKSSVSMTSPKGSLLAQINNLRKELKDIKQSKKQATALSEKPIKDFTNTLSKTTSKQKCVTSMSGSAKDKFFRSSKEGFTSPNKLKTSNLAFQTEKSFEIERKQKYIKKEQTKDIIQQQKYTVQISIDEVYLKEKDRKLKLDIQLNKLRKTIVKFGPQQIATQLNYIISLINISTRQYASRLEILQKNQKDDSSQEILLIKRQEQQIDIMSKKIVQYELQIKDMKIQLKNSKQTDQSLEELNNLSILQKNQIRSHAEMLQSYAKQLEEKNVELQELNRIFEVKLLKKEEQLIMLNEDVNYLRIETQNYKQQNKSINELYEKTTSEIREFKRSKQIQIQKIQQEKQKWQKQCKLRRNQSQDLTALEQQKIALMKQISQLRNLCSLKSVQLDDKKSLMHQNQKKVISLESQVYRLRSQIQTIKNKNQFSEFQNEKLKQELEDLKRILRSNHLRSKQRPVSKNKSEIQNQKIQNITKNQGIQIQNQQFDAQYEEDFNKQRKKQHFSKSLKQKQQKLRALEDIHSLIRKHKQQMLA